MFEFAGVLALVMLLAAIVLLPASMLLARMYMHEPPSSVEGDQGFNSPQEFIEFDENQHRYGGRL